MDSSDSMQQVVAHVLDGVSVGINQAQVDLPFVEWKLALRSIERTKKILLVVFVVDGLRKLQRLGFDQTHDVLEFLL